jgi:protein O-mannosyl-transferase
MLLLYLVNLIIYWQVHNFDFIVLDDPAYILLNQIVKRGLTFDGFKWAFMTFDYNTANWHPLTWLSFMLEWQLYGMNAGGYHWTNLHLHIANTLMLFVVLNQMTKTLWQSAFVAVLFAVHPLHVESVAWISERKDVLCTLFWFLAIWTYFRYVEHKAYEWYFATILFFIFGLTAKPMVVTFPFVLILLDYWPLHRFEQQTKGIQSSVNSWKTSFFCFIRSNLHLFLEKLPLFILSFIFSAIAFLAQKSGDALQSLANLPLTLRVANAFVAYITYIFKMIWPFNLAVFYPIPDAWPVWHILLAFILIVFISTMAVLLIKNYPYFITGWFWYLGTLVPVIGLVQVGTQSMADRYTYIPLTGLFIVIVWGTADIIKKRYLLKVFVYLFSVCIICVFMIVSWFQIQQWRNSITLFKHTLAVTKENYFAWNGMGVALRMIGDFNGAELHFKEALRIRPLFAEAHANLGGIYYRSNELNDATFHLHEAIRLSPRFENAVFNLGHVYLVQKKYAEAADEYKKLLKLSPNNAEVHNYLGVALICQKNIDEAVREFQTALKIQPTYTKAKINLSNALKMKNSLINTGDENFSNTMDSNKILDTQKSVSEQLQ